MKGAAALAVAALTVMLIAGHPSVAQTTAAPPAPQAPPAPAWLPRHTADLVALDKISARATKLSVDVGQSATFGTLTIAVRACDVRPPDVPEDATAWLDITDSTPGAPQFHGWIVKSAPAVSGLQHPSYDVRLAGCQ